MAQTYTGLIPYNSHSQHPTQQPTHYPAPPSHPHPAYNNSRPNTSHHNTQAYHNNDNRPSTSQQQLQQQQQQQQQPIRQQNSNIVVEYYHTSDTRDSEHEVSAQLTKIELMSTELWKGLRQDAAQVFTLSRKRTLTNLSDIEVCVDNIIISLNMSTKHLMERPRFQTKFFSTIDRLRELIIRMRRVKQPVCCFASRWMSCIVDPTYFADKDIRDLCEEVFAKIKDVRGDFTMAFNLSGSVDVAGRVGTDVNIEQRDKRNLMNESLQTNVIKKHHSSVAPAPAEPITIDMPESQGGIYPNDSNDGRPRTSGDTGSGDNHGHYQSTEPPGYASSAGSPPPTAGQRPNSPPKCEKPHGNTTFNVSING